MEILNDRGYTDTDPQPQSVVWERMNLPIARGLRGLLYVLWDLSQVDPSDLSILFAGPGRLRIGFAELNPPAGQEPDDDEIKAAVRTCWENRTARLTMRPGRRWSASRETGRTSRTARSRRNWPRSPSAVPRKARSNPLYARAARVPRPWGLTTLFSDHRESSGARRRLERREKSISASRASAELRSSACRTDDTGNAAGPCRSSDRASAPAAAFGSFRDFALAINRSDAARSSKQRTVRPLIFGSRSAS